MGRTTNEKWYGDCIVVSWSVFCSWQPVIKFGFESKASRWFDGVVLGWSEKLARVWPLHLAFGCYCLRPSWRWMARALTILKPSVVVQIDVPSKSCQCSTVWVTIEAVCWGGFLFEGNEGDRGRQGGSISGSCVSSEARKPPEFKHINKGRKRN